MKVVNTVQELKAELAAFRSEGKKIGLVPTMGALHAGHASLVGRSVKENDLSILPSSTIKRIWKHILERWRQIVVCLNLWEPI